MVVNVHNVEEGKAEYAITDNNGALSVALVDANVDDPDGVVGGVSYQWFKIETDGTRTNVGTDSATYIIASGYEDLIHGVYIGYTDGAGTVYTHTDNDDATTVEAITPPIQFSQEPIEVPENQASTPAFHTLMAEVDGAPMGSTIEFTWQGDVGDLPNIFGLATDGALTVDGLIDYESVTSYTLPIVITYDADGDTTTTNDQETRDVEVVINLLDANDIAPEIGALQLAQGRDGRDSSNNRDDWHDC